jgi:hypothetical protein
MVLLLARRASLPHRFFPLQFAYFQPIMEENPEQDSFA